MSGFHHDELADVNLITDNLRDRYKDQFSILKELVQNADDARAQNLRFGLVAGNEGNAHCLLRGPGLVAVNDGPFTDSDFHAICSFGLNSKAGDLGTIGKYGLGMKSVFHLGEAFFFVAESQSRTYKELLTPWGGIRSDWDIPEEQWSRQLPSLRRNWLRAVRWAGDSASFILYVPLRQKAHLQLPDGRTAGAIIENYPGDDHGLLTLLSSENTWVRLTALLPLLRDLVSIQVYVPADDGSSRRVHSCELDEKSIRPLREHHPGDSELRAAITTRGQQVLSAGWQRFRFTEILDRLRAAPAWPASWIRDGLQERRVPDKAQPHAAAVFMRDTVPGKLTIRWAVFLPVDEHEESVPIDPGMGGYSLTLHGHFFADAGRNGLYGLDDSDDASSFPNEEARIRREWNVALAENSTLDLLLPAIQSFCQSLGMAEDRVSALTGAIRNSKMWARRKASIAANHKWLRVVAPGGLHWALVSDERTLPLPSAPDKDSGRPWRVFPGLAGLGNHVVLFDPWAQNLVARDSDLGSWEEDEAADLIAGIDAARTFDSSVDADYAARFLEQLTVLRSGAVRRELRGLLRRAVQAVGVERLRNIGERVSRIAQLIPPELKLRITLRNPSVAELLILQETEALPWPKELDGGEASFQADVDTLQILLTSLSDHTVDAEACRLYAQELLALAEPDTRRALLKRAGHLPVLNAFDCRTGQRASVSAHFIAGCRERRTLFRTGQGITDRDRAELGPQLQDVLPKEAVLVVSKELAGLVLGLEEADEIPPCNAKGVLSCLGHCSRELGDSVPRRELLRSLKLPDRDAATIRGMRFLLHGAPESFGRNDQLWTGRGKISGVWRKLWEGVNAPEFRWTVIDPSLAELVTPADQDALNLHDIEPEHVIKVVAERGSPATLELNGTECDTILGYSHWEEETWKSLPAHLTAQGNRVRIGEMTYLADSNVQLPPELLSCATIIQQSASPEVRELQSRWIPELDLRAAVALALQSERPEVWCKQILDWFYQMKGEHGQTDWPGILYSTPWLKLRSGGAVSPNKLIVLQEAESETTELAKTSNDYATPSMLEEGLSGHSALELLSDREGNLGALHSMLRDEVGMTLGNIELKPEIVRSSAEMMQSCPDESARVWRLIARLCSAYGVEEGQQAFHASAKPISADRLRAILIWLAGRPGTDAIFTAYLTAFAKTAQGPGVLRGLQLRTAAGTWKAAQEICVDVPGADRGSVLCEEHYGALIQIARRGSGKQVAQRPRRSSGAFVETVRQYFAPWASRSNAIRAQAGVLVTLLAGTTELTTDADKMLDPHHREWVLSHIPWQNPSAGGFFRAVTPLDALTLQQAIATCTIHFSVENVTDISCVSLTGDVLRVPIERRIGTLLVGRPEWIDGTAIEYNVSCRKLDLNTFSNTELSAILRATAEHLIRYLYLRPANLHTVWSKLDQTEQLHLETAEKLILEYLPFYLGQIRPVGAPALTRKLGEIEELRRLRIEYSDDPARASDYQGRRHGLGRMLKDDAEVQRAVLDGVRARLRDLEYQESSIAFELFQNADDAYVQSGEISRAGGENSRSRNRFIVLLEDGALAFMHWGRPINYGGPSGFDGRERGYHRDLERMLTLSGSDKQDIAEVGRRVTGKFGLGFKSVLLVCDRPEVASAGLEFEIRAGVLPHVLDPSQAEHLRSLVQRWSREAAAPGTILRLPGVQDSSAILDDFRRNAGCLCAFSSSIREISIVAPGRRQDAAWDGRKVASNGSIQAGTLPFGEEEVNALRIQMDDAVALFGLGAEGITDLPKETPSVWVTCPTREDQHFGFAVCGKFHVDPGRARLSRNAENETQAVRIGTLLGQRLRELRLAPWEIVRGDLRLAQATAEYEFWASLWRLYQRTMKQPESAVGAILKPILTGAMKALANELAVVPNGLPGAARMLTTGPKLRHKLSGVFGVEGSVKPLFDWPEWKAREYTPDTLISQANSAGLGEIGVDGVASISLASVASWMVRKIASPADATAFGGVLRALPKKEDRPQEIAEDLRRAERTLEDVQFRSEGRTSEQAGDLVTAAFGDDEARRAAFAPPNRRLSLEYDESGREFFRFCRGPMGVGASDLAQWVRQAGDPAPRRAALTYLVRGDLGLQVQRQLAILGTDGTWLAALSEEELPAELRNELLRPAVQVRPALPVTVRVADPRPSLERIEQWWQRNAAAQIAEYNQRVYPNGRAPRLKPPWHDDFDRSDRSEWLILFARAAFYRAGRVTDAQHRGFIEMSQRHGFWSVYSAEDPRSRADEWMNVLEQFCDDQVDSDIWEHWMRFFPHLYKLSRRLDEYAELFLRLEAEAGDYDLDAVLAPRADPGQHGGGINPPPPSLGIGACFVVRELLRFGHLESPFSHRHAFVPARGVRELLLRLGLLVDNTADVAVSVQIYEELARYLGPDRATFSMAFDIPFQIIAANPDLEHRLVWESASGAEA